jgi:hypothetical protein
VYLSSSASGNQNGGIKPRTTTSGKDYLTMHEESTFQQHGKKVYREVRDGERWHWEALPHMKEGKRAPLGPGCGTTVKGSL